MLQFNLQTHGAVVRAKDFVINGGGGDFIGDPVFELEMQKRIVTVNGNALDYIQIEDYVNNMVAMDSSVYHDKVDRFTFGVVRLNTCDCENPVGCDGKAIWVLKADREFFRPCIDD